MPVFCNPYFRCICNWFSFRNMNMNRFHWFTFIYPEINPVRTYFKDLRHLTAPQFVQIQG